MILVVLWTNRASAQHRTGVAYTDTLRVSADSTLQTRPFVVQETVRVRIPARNTHPDLLIDAVRGVIRLTSGARPGDLAIVSYRALPLGIPTEFRLDRQPINVPERRRPARPPPPRPSQEQPSGVLRSRGSISRGIIGGSNRDVAVESGLRLELDGELAPGVGIRASLTDADSPIRPDGSTQRLSEFDRVFIEMTADAGRVLMGDFDALLQGSVLAGLRRKLQGVMVQGAAGDRVNVTAVGATSRGEYRSQTIVAIDGVQGPYGLDGASGEPFVLVLPGSERVYLDGRLLTRGEASDYIVDYATAELTFTARNLISADRRILVEFQYATNQFTRTLLASEFETRLGPGVDGKPRFTFGGSVIREADSGEFLSEFGLSAADSVLLSQAGDADAFQSGAQLVTYDPEARFTHYVVEPRGADSIFVALSTRPEQGVPVYRVQFSRIGEGLGAYVRSAQSLNGIAYEYRGPGQGAYDPVRRLPRPNRRSVVGLRGSMYAVRGLNLQGEWAGSSVDLNRLSALDGGDNQGSAVRLSAATGDASLGRLGRVRVAGTFRQSSEHFATFERYREVEFGRRWNLGTIPVAPTGTIAGARYERESDLALTWSLSDSSFGSLSLAELDLPGVFDARRAVAGLGLMSDGLPRLRADYSYVASHNQTTQTESSWRRGFARIEDDRGALSLFGEIETEKRLEGRSDSLNAASIRFTELRPGVRFGGQSSWASGQVERRVESWPVQGVLTRAADSWTVSGSAGFARGNSTRGDVELGWRTRSVSDAAQGVPGAVDTRALLLAVNAVTRVGIVGLDWLYDARTERTPVLQEIFLRTGPELGAYVWEDQNGDDVVQTDELLPETTPNEGVYVRTFIPSDSLASVNAVRARLVSRIRPSTNANEVRWNAQTVFDVEERSRAGKRRDVYLLRLDRFRMPGLTTSGRIRIRQDASVFFPSSGVRLEGTFQESRTLSELASGIETKTGRLVEMVAGVRVTERINASLRVSTGRDFTHSDRFPSRRFRLRSRRFAPAVTVRTGATTLQLTLEAATKRDALVDRDARIIRIPVSARVARAGRGDVFARLEVADITLSGGPATGLASFQLTDGRGPGRSALWGLTSQWSLTSSLRATISYDGRAPAAGKAVHTGRVQLSAVF